MSGRDLFAALGLGAALLFAGTQAQAATLDFTQATGDWGDPTSSLNSTGTRNLGGINVELSAESRLNTSNPRIGYLTDREAGPGAAACVAAGLTCASDGVGVIPQNFTASQLEFDDEVNIDQGERLTINFVDGPVSIDGVIWFLDLFDVPSDPNERVQMRFFDGLDGAGAAVNGTLTLTGTSTDTNGLAGQVVTGLSGVRSIQLSAVGGSNSDFALAGITGVVPLPGAVLFFGTAMAGLVAARARRRKASEGAA